MADRLITLKIISPRRLCYEGKVSLVRLPGELSPFTVLPRHGALISSLIPGEISYKEGSQEKKISIDGGFVEVVDDNVTVCIE